MTNERVMSLDEAIEVFGKGCGHKDCNCKEGPMYLHSRCHPEESSVQAFYKDMKIHIQCNVCSETIVVFPIANRKE